MSDLSPSSRFYLDDLRYCDGEGVLPEPRVTGDFEALDDLASAEHEFAGRLL